MPPDPEVFNACGGEISQSGRASTRHFGLNVSVSWPHVDLDQERSPSPMGVKPPQTLPQLESTHAALCADGRSHACLPLTIAAFKHAR